MSSGVIRVVAECGAKVGDGTCGEQFVAELYMHEEYEFDEPPGWHVQVRRDDDDADPLEGALVRCPRHCSSVPTGVDIEPSAQLGVVRRFRSRWVDAP